MAVHVVAPVAVAAAVPLVAGGKNRRRSREETITLTLTKLSSNCIVFSNVIQIHHYSL